MSKKSTAKKVQLDAIKHSERRVWTVRPAVFENKKRKAELKRSRERISV